MSGNEISELAGLADRLVREQERRRITGVSRSTAWRLERRGEFPRRRAITAHSVGWSAVELHQWVKARPIIGGVP